MMTREERLQELASRRRPTGSTRRIWVPDRFRDFEIWEVPRECLLLNVDNRRFRAERMWAEEQLGHSLDPENNPDDLDSVESLLLDTQHRLVGTKIVGKESDDATHLRKDWGERGQEEPLWIRPDGTVRNGNRRLAMLRRSSREEGGTGKSWPLVVFLDPEEIDEPTLLEMEQREQLTENFKVRYNDIDYLLALREAAENENIDWSDPESLSEVSGRLQSMVQKSPGEVLRDLTAIRWMDYFLDESGQSGQYHKLMRQLERFRDVGRTMVKVEEDYPTLAPDVLEVLFAAIRAGHPHQDIRKLRNMFLNDRERFIALRATIVDTEGDWDPMTSGIDTPTDTGSSDTEDGAAGGDEGDTEGPTLPDYPRAKVKEVIRVAIDGFETEGEDAQVLLKEVCHRLERVGDDPDFETDLLDDGERGIGLRESVKTVLEWAKKYASQVEN